MIIDGSYQGHNIVFIVGCPRSGTTWLQRMLAALPGVRTGQESHLFDYYIGPQVHIWDHALQQADRSRGGVGMGCYLEEQTFLERVRAYMISLLQPILADVEADEVFVEKTPDHALYVSEIHRLLPQARIIHIVRDPRAVVASLVSASRGWGASWAPATASRAAYMWSRYVRAVQQAAAPLPADRFLELRYEEIHDRPAAALHDVAGFLGRQWADADVAAAVAANSFAEVLRGGGTRIPVAGAFGTPSGAVVEPDGFVRKGRPTSWKQELSRRQRAIVRLIAGAEMERLGYAGTPPPPLLPLAAALRSATDRALARYVRRYRRRRDLP